MTFQQRYHNVVWAYANDIRCCKIVMNVCKWHYSTVTTTLKYAIATLVWDLNVTTFSSNVFYHPHKNMLCISFRVRNKGSEEVVYRTESQIVRAIP